MKLNLKWINLYFARNVGLGVWGAKCPMILKCQIKHLKKLHC